MQFNSAKKQYIIIWVILRTLLKVLIAMLIWMQFFCAGFVYHFANFVNL